MSVNANFDCYAVTGSTPQWVAEIVVKVDGKVVGSASHEVADGGPWWEFNIPVYLDGTHTVEVWDRTATQGPFLGATQTLSCESPTTTTTTTNVPETAAPTTAAPTTAATTVAPTTALPPATAPATTVQPSVSSAVVVAPPSNLPPQVSAGVVNTLPATGADVDGYIGAGAGLLAVGAVLLAVTRRRVAFGRRSR